MTPEEAIKILDPETSRGTLWKYEDKEERLEAVNEACRLAVAPPSAAPEPPQENGPEVYQKIENILAALPGDMGQKARWAAEKMVAEVFAEYLKVRLRVEENEET